MTPKKFPWKKNFHKIPMSLLGKVKSFSDGQIIVSCIKSLKQFDIDDGLYSHVGINIDKTSKEVSYQRRIFPNPETGNLSRLNSEGKVVVRKDLPMVTQTYTWETPNFGDPSNGYHDVSRDRNVYQRDFVPPKNLEITVELMDTQTIGGQLVYIFKFIVDEVLDPQNKSFKDDLLYNLNLLQENVGRSDVFSSKATRVDYLRTVIIDWEILPPGKRDETINMILGKYRKISPEEKERIEDRYDFLTKFKPEAYISGVSGFQRYFGAKFNDKLVVFENLRYGNAIYVMYENWEKLSKKSRIELLKVKTDDFNRVVHREGWKGQLKLLLLEKLNGNK